MMHFILAAGCLLGVAFQDGVAVPAPSTNGSNAGVSIGKRCRAGSIEEGVGYSSDLNQAVSNKCYKMTENVRTHGEEGGDPSLVFKTYTKLGRECGDESVEEKCHRYLRFIDESEKDHCLYLLSGRLGSGEDVSVPTERDGEDILNDFGKVYNSDEKRYFGLICGDKYFPTYTRAAAMISGQFIRFDSKEAKNKFVKEVGVSVNVLTSSEKIKDAVEKYHISGSFVVHAYQTGGNTSELAKILKEDPIGHYHYLECNLTAVDSCIQAWNELERYRHNFITQLEDHKITLAPLNIHPDRAASFEMFGLKMPGPLTQKEVDEYCNEPPKETIQN